MGMPERTPEQIILEARDRIHYQYLNIDGTVDYPNSFDGDILRLVVKAADALTTKGQDT